MEADEALICFLKGMLIEKKDRYIGFLSKEKTRYKFLNSIYHELEGILDQSKKVASLPEKAFELPCYKFVPPNTFGEKVTSLKVGSDQLIESFLLVTTDGKYAIHGPETYVDSKAYYIL